MMVNILTLLLHLYLHLLRVLDVDYLRVFYQLRLRQVPENVFFELKIFKIRTENLKGSVSLPQVGPRSHQQSTLKLNSQSITFIIGELTTV